MNKKHLVFIDLETTGLDYTKDKTIEVAAVKTDLEGVIKYGIFHEYIKIDFPVPKFITELTGITDTILDIQGKDPSTVFTELGLFIGDAIIVAHNAPFDLSFLEAGAIGYGFDFIDTRSLAKLDSPFDNPSLQPTLSRLGLKSTEEIPHTALGDVFSLIRLYGYFIDRYGFTPNNVNRVVYTGRTHSYLPIKLRKMESIDTDEVWFNKPNSLPRGVSL